MVFRHSEKKYIILIGLFVLYLASLLSVFYKSHFHTGSPPQTHIVLLNTLVYTLQKVVLKRAAILRRSVW